MNYCWRIGSPLLNRLFIVDYLGRAAALPGPTVSVDVIITNGVFNLCLDKPKVIAEMGRVLRHGGQLQLDWVSYVRFYSGRACIGV